MRDGVVEAMHRLEATRTRCLGDSSDESWWRVGRANPDMRDGVVEAMHHLEATRTRCLALFSFDEKVPGTAPIALRERTADILSFENTSLVSEKSSK